MPEWITEALSTATPYWPVITKILVLWMFGQFFKKRVWTRQRAAAGGFHKLMRDTLPLHAPIAGGLWGLAWPFLPAVEFVTTRGGAVSEGLLAGVLSMAAFSALEHVAQARGWTWVLGVLKDAGTVRESTVPPPAGTQE
jgi:hypothetical protein